MPLRAPSRGEHVRIVEMNGCMAHSRENIRDGVVRRFVTRQVYGDSQLRSYAVIQLQDGTLMERVAEPNLWFEFEGVLEYRI